MSEAQDRIVEMQDGTKVNFGVRANLLSSINLAESSLNFKVFSGESISYVVEGITGYPEFHQKAILSGLMGKIKGNTAAVKVIEDVLIEQVQKNESTGEEVKVKVPSGETYHALAQAIEKQIAELKEGKFNIRGNGEDELALSDDHIAFATSAYKYDVPYANKKWKNLEDEKTIVSIIETWDGMDRKGRAEIRKNPYFRHEKCELEIARLKDVTQDVVTA